MTKTQKNKLRQKNKKQNCDKNTKKQIVTKKKTNCDKNTKKQIVTEKTF